MNALRQHLIDTGLLRPTRIDYYWTGTTPVQIPASWPVFRLDARGADSAAAALRLR